MSYSNPLHAKVSPYQISGYSSLAGAVTPYQPRFALRHRKLLRQSLYVPSTWKQATARFSGIIIPFDVTGQSGQGISMQGVHAATTMQGANDPVLMPVGTDSIVLRIVWDGYHHLPEWTRTIPTKVSGAHITRQQLAAKIAENYARFIETNASARCTEPDNGIAINNVQMFKLVLVGLHNVYDNVWQAVVAWDSPC